MVKSKIICLVEAEKSDSTSLHGKQEEAKPWRLYTADLRSSPTKS